MPFTNTRLEAASVRTKLLKKSAFNLVWKNAKNISNNFKKYIFKPKIGTVILPIVFLFGGVIGLFAYSPIHAVISNVLGSNYENTKNTVPENMKIAPTENGVGIKLKTSDTLSNPPINKKPKQKK